ncbi:hypothetical protein [Embleya sp. NPDC005971]|uniref:hypothetical protein n=1 Tax=Embleya sp. NPDC005971 TaxID=3156724 RepID=UPI0034113610
MADTRPPGDGDTVEHTDFGRGEVVGNVQLGCVWVRPDNGGPKWNAPVGNVRIVSRFQAPNPPAGW